MEDMSSPESIRRVLENREQQPGFDTPIRDRPEPTDMVIQIEIEPGQNFRGDIGTTELVERFTDRVDELGAAVAVIAERLRSSLESRFRGERSARWTMSEVGMEFGVNLEAEMGVVVCKGKTAAAFKVSIKWAPTVPDSIVPPP